MIGALQPFVMLLVNLRRVAVSRSSLAEIFPLLVIAPEVRVPTVVLPKLFELPDAVMLPLAVTVVTVKLLIVVFPKLLLFPEAMTLALLVIAPEEMVPMLVRLRLESMNT